VKINWAVSGLRYDFADESSIGPTLVVNIKLNSWTSSNSSESLGHFKLCFFTSSLISFAFIPSAGIFNWSSINVSALIFSLHFLQVNIRSSKFSACPEAFHTFGFVIIEPSIPAISSRCLTWNFHHSFLRLFFNSTPKCAKSKNPDNGLYISAVGYTNPFLLQNFAISSIVIDIIRKRLKLFLKVMLIYLNESSHSVSNFRNSFLSFWT